MSEAWLECVACGNRAPLAASIRGCSCGAEFEVRFAPGKRPFPPSRNRLGVWRWADWLPELGATVDGLCAGETPLLRLRTDEQKSSILIKNETRNPTWSWKDRPNAVSVAAAKRFGFSRIAVISTGNHGVAAAAFAAASGLRCTVYCHEDAPPACTSLMALFGAEVVMGGDRAAALQADLDRGDTFPGTILDGADGFTNPFGVEGFKTIAFEIVEQLGGRAPDRVYVPTGSGDGVYGVWKGFRELQAAGVIPNAPRMIACQSSGADSLARAFAQQRNAVEPLAAAMTRALSIAEVRTGNHALRAVYESFGDVMTVDDEQAIAASELLARQGTAVELASAVPLACVLRDQASSVGTSVVIASGAITKWPSDLSAYRPDRRGTARTHTLQASHVIPRT